MVVEGSDLLFGSETVFFQPFDFLDEVAVDELEVVLVAESFPELSFGLH